MNWNPFKKKKKEISKENISKNKEDVKKEIEEMREEYKEFVDKQNILINEAVKSGEPVEDVLNKHLIEQQKDDTKIPENLYEKKDWKLKLFEKTVMLLCIGLIMALIVWAFRFTIQTTDQNSKNLVVYLVLACMLILVVLLLNIGTGTGIEIWKRFVYKFKYRRGIYVNGIIAMKSGVWKEFFIKKEETGEIRINKKPYVPNPKLLFIYKGIPSYFYREGNPDPLNYWETKLTLDFSCAEVDNVMYSASTFDFKAWLQRNLMIFLIGVVATVIFALVASVVGFMIYNMLKKGQYNIEPMTNVCKEIFNIYTNTTTNLTSTGNIPIPKPIGG